MPRKLAPVQPGSAAPDFVLPAVNGETVGLWECLLEGPVWIEFIRGTWCPNARRRLAELARRRDELRPLWTRLLVVACEDPFTVQRYFQRAPSPLTVLIDVERSTAKSYGVHVRFGLDGWNVARPSSFLVDRAGYVRFAFLAADQTEVCPVETIKAEISRFDAAPPD